MTDIENNPPAETPAPAFESKLTDPRQRFLAQAMEHSIVIGRRSAEDFLRHFPPEVIMEGMAQHPEIRALILSKTTGIKEKIAGKKSWKSAAEDLQIALSEGETTASTVIGVFPPDDRVRYLPKDKLWNFLIEGEFYAVPVSRTQEFRVAKQHVAFLLDCALKEKLVTYQDIIDGISVAELATRLPKAEVGKLLEAAITAGRKNKPFTDVELWQKITAATVVEHVPLAHIWSNVIVQKIAKPHGFGTEAKLTAGQPPLAPEGGKANTPEEQDWVELPEDTVAAGDLVSEDDFA